jgi:uncharacterized BrkB/YihY/UPF0761 family membrane protein
MNPTGQPMGTPMPSAPSGAAKDAVNLPSLFIIILGALGGLMVLMSLVGDSSGMSTRMLQQYIENLPADQQEQMQKILAMSQASRSGGIFTSVIGLGLAGFVVFAGLQMRSLKNWGVSLAGAILVMIPCSTSCCCCLGIPVGIWALITLTKPEVKSAFS